MIERLTKQIIYMEVMWSSFGDRDGQADIARGSEATVVGIY